MWFRKPPGSVRHWEEYAAYQTAMMRLLIAGLRKASLGENHIAEAVVPCVEDIHCASVYIDLVKGAGSFDDFAWIDRRHKAAIARFDKETDAVLLPGLRRIVTSWYEEKAYFKMKMTARVFVENGNPAGADALCDDFAAWMTARAGVPWTKPEDRRLHYEYKSSRIDPEEWRGAGERLNSFNHSACAPPAPIQFIVHD